MKERSETSSFFRWIYLLALDQFRKGREVFLLRRTTAFLFQITGIIFSLWLAIQLRFDFDIPGYYQDIFSKFLLPVGSGYFISIVIFRLYRGLWRFFTLRDCFVAAAAVAAGSVLAAIIVYLTNDFTYRGFPRSLLVTTSMLLLAWEIGWRGLIRLIREHRIRRIRMEGAQQGVLLFGNPDEADALLRQLMQYPDRIGKVVGLVSHRSRHRGLQLRGVRIYGADDDLPRLIREKEVSTILFLPPLNSPASIRNVMETVSASGLKCEYRFLPSIDDLTSGRLSVDQMRRVSIEDLLHRSPHSIDLKKVEASIRGKRVMVTGAGGSIGSEICRQILEMKPKSLVLFEASEYFLFEIDRELEARARELEIPIVSIAGDVRRSDQVREAIEGSGGVDILYHSAAYKHVHLMERNPVACFHNNVIGTECVASVAEECGVGEFVLISTDKAVRPASLMGASKRLAERIVIERPEKGTRFKAVRFGNVLGSSGSVIPIFREQIRKGGPVTVTSEEVTRFFMTIPEAVELVIAAGALTDDRRICVLEMGEPVKIDTLARRMIELSGFIPEVDIPIVYTGLRPGEKEYEELLTDDEGVVRTDHDRIWVVEKSQTVDAPPLNTGDLLELLDLGDEASLREYAHSLIPGSQLK